MASNRVETSNSALQTANSLFVDEKYEEALKEYNLAVELDPTNVEAHLKRSACHYKMESFTDSLSDANEVLRVQPNNSKAYLRKGIACFALEEYESAQVAFSKGQELDPSDSTFKTWLRKCKAELESEEGSSAAPSTSTPQAPSPSPSPTQTPPPKDTQPTVKIRHEWYQTSSDVIVTIFAKNIKKEDATIDISKKSLSVTIKTSASSDYQLDFDLCGEIIPEQSKTIFLSTKIEIKLKKVTQTRWKTLEDVGEAPSQWDSVVSTKPPAPSKKNWDKIVEEETGGEKLDGEESLNKVFQDIYGNGTEEQRRAMMKSFVESGGTVLSTNWDEVGKGQVKGTPPEGMEMRKWGEQ